jgi:hypothetical protein
VSSLIVVFGAFALLKINISGKRAPQELVTGSIQRSPAVRRSASNDPMAAFLVTPSVAPATQGMKQMAVGVSSPIPLPRPRPNRLWVLASMKSLIERHRHNSGNAIPEKIDHGEPSYCFVIGDRGRRVRHAPSAARLARS